MCHWSSTSRSPSSSWRAWGARSTSSPPSSGRIWPPTTSARKTHTTAGDPMTTLEALETLLRDRRVRAPEGSYSVTLVRDPERASRKIMEEAYELCHELTRPGVDHG